MCDRFVLPVDTDRDLSPSAEDTVCVVGVVSKNNVASSRLVDQATERPRLLDADASGKGCRLKCSYDAERCVLYVELIRHDDWHVCADREATTWEKKVQEEREYLQALLLLFSICHIVVLFMPQHHIDLSYVKMFKLVGDFRQKIEEDILDFLEQKLDPDVWQTWQDNGCCTIPLLLLVFAETLPISLSSTTTSSKSFAESSNTFEEMRGTRREQPSVKRLISALEDQANTIFNKCGITSGPSALLKLNRRGCVHVLPNESFENALSTVHLVLNILTPSQGQLHCTEDYKSFIDYHTDSVFSSQESQLPNYQSWVSVSSLLYRELLNSSGLARNIPTSFTAVEEFSESLCAKAYNLAIKTYKESLSARFTERDIQLQLAHCRRVYQLNARGPAFGKYLEKLEKESSEMEPLH
ncbi:nonsense-mediated mRNA decay factor SMG8-like [Corticium candelabrum]|uniref:nonsense-mediated mRNA decay factor SMG8-like n=1 Tax=Corticium candelabrum TaxID=121492 RepID=UPI002E25B68E|nr:nonsense-mediated mRNA decay factor SMG8-like [Corticium candelabrum]